MDNSYRAFGIALTGLLLEHEWPADVTHVIQQVHDALISNDKERISRAYRAAAAAAYAAAHAAHAAAAYAATTAAYAAAYAANYAANYATTTAATYATQALPGEATRIRALHTLLTQ